MFPLISIIMPIYNAGKYLNRSISSIIDQSYKNLEIILVNDGSIDNSLDICEQYRITDNRIKIISQENKGVVVARKIGVSEATGEFIAWVDADDWIEADYIEKLLELQRKSNAQIVAVAHYHDIGENSVLIKNGLENGVYSSGDIVSSMLCTGEFFEYGIGPHLYTKLFNAKILKKTQQYVPEKIFAGDDAAVVYTSILECDKICVSDIAGYHYIQNPGSITKVEFSDEQSRIDELISFLKDKFTEKKLLDETYKQLQIYRNYLLALRQIDVFDDNDKIILNPYGGIDISSRVIIYGAGVLGQKIYRYLNRKEVNIVAWLDQNWNTYISKGYDVKSPDMIEEFKGQYDYILIANITEKMAISIKRYLLLNGVLDNKIRWFTDEFCGKI